MCNAYIWCIYCVTSANRLKLRRSMQSSGELDYWSGLECELLAEKACYSFKTTFEGGKGTEKSD